MRKTLRKTDIKELNEKIRGYGVGLSKKDKVELLDSTMIIVNNTPFFFYSDDNRIIPTLKLLLQKQGVLKRITVDMGAVKFVASGADIMRPGIVFIDTDISKGETVVIADEKNQKPLAVGEALFDAKEMKDMSFGKVVKNIHFVGDKVWETQ